MFIVVNRYLTTTGNARRDAPLGKLALMVLTGTGLTKVVVIFHRPSAAVVGTRAMIGPVMVLPT